MKATAALAAVVFLLFFRPHLAFTVFGSLDPQCYLEHLHRFVGLPVTPCPSRSFLPGTALLWLPGAALARVAAALSGAGEGHLVRLSIGFTAFALWTASLFLVTLVFRRLAPRESRLWPWLWMLAAPILYYGAMRTTLSHGAEFFLACLVVWLGVEGRIWGMLVAAAFLGLVRLNAVPVFLLVGALAGRRPPPRHWWALWALTTAIFAARAGLVGWGRGYNQVTVPFVVHSFTVERVAAVLAGSDWGLLWTAPWWVGIFAWGLWRWRTLSWVSRAALAGMAFNLAICLGWRGNGGDFAYRYLLGTFPGALLLWLENRPRMGGFARRALLAALAYGAVVTTYLTWIYRTAPELSPRVVRVDGGVGVPDFLWIALGRLTPEGILGPLGLSAPAVAVCSWLERGTCGATPLLAGSHRLALTAAVAAVCLLLPWLLSPRRRQS